MFCSFYLILYIIWFQFSLSLSPFYYFDLYEHQYFTFVLFHMFSFIKNALFGSYSWISHKAFIESSAVTAAFWLDQYGGRFASIFRRCPPSMFWGQWIMQLIGTFMGPARMRCHSRNTKHTGGLCLYSREFPEFDLFWSKTKRIFSEFVWLLNTCNKI